MSGKEKHERLKKIRDEILNLTASPLYPYRTKNNYLPVIGEGNHDAKIMFIGEAPGKNEAETGRPFCGAAGKVLDELLRDIGIARADVYVTNIVKDRPPENRDPLPEEIEIGLGCVSCQPGQIDSADTIVSRVETALKYLPPDRIILNPDCGFAPGSAANVSLDEVYTKLKNEVAAACLLRAKYG